jgi:integrase
MRTVKHAALETPTARKRLKRGRQPHLQSLIAGQAALGYQRKEGVLRGRWLLRRSLGGDKYAVVPLGLADDGVEADGASVLTFEEAKAKALAVLAEGGEVKSHGRLTVRKAFALYVDYLAQQGKRTLETERRGAALILPELGDLYVADLTSDRIRKWLSKMAASPALLRSKLDAKKRNTKAAPGDDAEAIRRRQSSANRVLTMLKAALNHAYDEKLVANNEAWGRRVKPFRDVEVARTRYLSIVEAKRLLNACNPSFRQMVQAALETGGRYGELCRLAAADFNPDAGTVTIRRSKSGKSRSVILSDEGTAYFSQITVGRQGNELILRNTNRVQRALEAKGKNPSVDDAGEWRPAEQGRLMREACERAKIAPPISIHGLRHTWASLAAMAGVPLMVIAKNLGHADTRMVEKHYGHLAPSFVVDAIRKGAPRFGFKPDKKVVALSIKEKKNSP